jgi:hypothetical protein
MAQKLGLDGGGIKDLTDIYMGPPPKAPEAGPGTTAPSSAPLPSARQTRMPMPSPYPTNKTLGAEIRGEASPSRGAGGSGIDLSGIPQMEYGEAGGPLQLRQHPVYSAQAQGYLNKYGVNV